MASWERWIHGLVNFLKRLGGAALVGMMLMTCVDVITRYFGHPVFGAVEIVSFLGVIILACAMPCTHVDKGHVGVELFVRRLSPKTQAVIDSLTAFLSGGLFAVIAWQMADYGQTLRAAGEVSMSLRFPDYMLVYLAAVAFGVLTLAIVVEFVDNLRKVVN